MTDERTLQTAQNRFQQFLHGFTPSPGQMHELGEAVSTCIPAIEIPANEAVDAFLDQFPEYNDLRDCLTDEICFSVAKEQWENTVRRS